MNYDAQNHELKKPHSFLKHRTEYLKAGAVIAYGAIMQCCPLYSMQAHITTGPSTVEWPVNCHHTVMQLWASL
jgi:hypothetical protein